MNEYDDPAKDVAWAAYWEGYTQGYGVEEMQKIDERSAKSRFERYWKRNAET